MKKVRGVFASLRVKARTQKAANETAAKTSAERGQRIPSPLHGEGYDGTRRAQAGLCGQAVRPFANFSDSALNAVETSLANEPTEFIRYSLTLVLEQLRETEKEIEDAKCRDSLE